MPSQSARLTTVRVAEGQLGGTPSADGSIVAFKGVPFAAPPIGDRRWRAPQAAAPWQGVRQADTFGANCVQNIVDARKPWTYEFMAHGATSEDCLYLNVWTPAKAAAERHPVYVFIHGGANTEGSGSVPVYDGSGLASKGLVVVTINYRLGAFGFLAHPELTQEAPYHASGNYGLLDQIAAVKWVKANIAAFGGDPSRITVAGQSAGAFGVRNLIVSPLAAGQFQRAIAESGVSLGGFGASRTLADAEQDGVRFARAKNVASIAELRALAGRHRSRRRRSAARRSAGAPSSTTMRSPASEADALASGKFNDVPVLTGIEPRRERRRAAADDDGRRVREAGAAALRRSSRGVAQALSGRLRRRGTSGSERQRARRLARHDLDVDCAARQDREDAGLHVFLGSHAAGSRRRRNTARSTPRKCPT